MNNPEFEKSIGVLGERLALQLGLAPLRRGEAALVPTGDDAAVVPVADGRFVITTDTMFEGGDFLTEWSSAFDLGWKAIATNAADVAAMGARPVAFTVALGVPATTPVAWLRDFATGLQAAIDQLCPGAEVVGGDLASATPTVIAVTATGHLDGRNPVLRSSATPGDVVALAGTLGKAAAGLALLQHGDRQLIDSYRDLVAIQLRPNPPIEMGRVACEAGATAMLDVSDGLLLDAERLAQASDVVIQLDALLLEGYEAILELAAQSLAKPSACRAWVLSGGEDHPLLATFAADATLPKGFKRIGTVAARVQQQPAEVQLWRGDQRQDFDAAGTKGWDSVRR